MEKKILTPTELAQLEQSLECLNIRQLEERLEVSTLMPGGGGQEFNQDIFDINWENCCNGGKCSGNTVPTPTVDFIDDDSGLGYPL